MAQTPAETHAIKAHRLLDCAQSRDAAWHVLFALSRDRTDPSPWALVGRILLELNDDPLGTLALCHATQKKLPAVLEACSLRMQRISLWTLGLIAHESEAAILPLSVFEDERGFRNTHKFDPWIQGELEQWKGWEGALLASERLVGVLSEAYLAPDTEDNPLLEDGWATLPAYDEFCLQQPTEVAEEQTIEDPVADPSKITVISDHWMEQEVAKLGASAQFEIALEQCALWRKARPQRLVPRIMTVRLLHAQEKIGERDRFVEEILGVHSSDLNELEEARLALGELELWHSQIEILNQMDGLAPSHPVILANRGAARVQVGDVVSGKKDLDAALKVDPDNGPALANLGLQLMREENYESARKTLERAVRLNPGQAQTRVYLAACKNNQGETDAAIEQLNKAVELDPENEQAEALLKELKSRFRS